MFLYQVIIVIDGEHPSEVKEQALCIVANIAAGAGVNDYVMEEEILLKRLLEFVVNIYNIIY